MESNLGAHIALAHDTEWVKTGTNSVLMGMLDEESKEGFKVKLAASEAL